MSLFETLSHMSKQHVNAVESGVYTFENPIPATEVAHEEVPTQSVYNLMDYSVAQLDHIHNVLTLGLQRLDAIKLATCDTYMDGSAFARILEGAIKERQARDSEAWATQTEKEIKETLS